MHVYLDHAASTAIRPQALAAWTEAALAPGNASSLHSAGRKARKRLEEGRERIASALGSRPQEVVFTSGGTEADNTALKGLFWGRQHGSQLSRPRLLVSAVEHHAVVDPAVWLAEHEGAELVWLPVDSTGRLDLDAYAEALTEDPDRTALVSVMWANNEVGTVQPIAEVVELAHAHGIPVHTDAVQAVGHVPVNIAEVPVDALSLSGHKLGGPLGVGAMLLRRGSSLVPLLHGGGQESGERSGTINVPGAAALATAVDLSVAELPHESARVSQLRDRLVEGVLQRIPEAELTGGALDSGRLPGIAHLRFPVCEGDSLLYLLDAAGVECSTGSACQAGVPQASHVLTAMGLLDDQARGALRFSLGHDSTGADVDHLLDVIPGVVARARSAGLASVAS